MEEKYKARYDFFRSFMYDGVPLVGRFEFPTIRKTNFIPNNPVSFVECRKKSHKETKWLHFYAEDSNFDCVWQTPNKYINLLKSFNGVITPDFSMYGDLPRAYQIWNCFRNRALACWWQRLGIKIVPSVSWVDESSFEWCFDGLPTGGTVAVSGNGCYFNPYSRERFINGFNAMKERLNPDLIIAVGYLPKPLKAISNLIVLPGYSQQRAARNG